MTTIVFDVNETLLDLAVLRPHFERHFGDPDVQGEWFTQVIQTALVHNILGSCKQYDFSDVGRQALDLVVRKHGITIAPNDFTAILKQMLDLPPHPDVIPALDNLKAAGLRLVALTNSNQLSAETQLKNGGIAPYFDKIMSVAAVKKFKPMPAVYEFGAKSVGETAAQLWMVAAHAWDVQGAMNVGWHGVFVARPGKVFPSEGPQPDIIGDDLLAVGNALIELLT
jgi:2-haloacid dehalogenase